jgi:sec-independent protein translocase protein TatC
MLLAAILTPTPDIANMLVFAAPMVFLYFLSVGIAWLFGKPRRLPKKTAKTAEAV